MADGPTEREKFVRDNDWRKREFQLKERDLDLKREEFEVKKQELALKEASSGGRRWTYPLWVSSGGWLVAIVSICVTLVSTSCTEKVRRENQLADESRKELQAGVADFARHILVAVSLMHELSSTYAVNGTAPTKEQYHQMLPKLQGAYTEIALARQRLFVLNPEVAKIWEARLEHVDSVFNKFQTMFANDYDPDDAAIRWSWLNCKLEETNTQSAVEKVAKYLRPPGSPQDGAATMSIPESQRRDCDKFSTAPGTRDAELRQILARNLRAMDGRPR
jgi:hypothetical protein